MSPPSVIPFPRSVKGPAGLAMVMPPKIVPNGKSLFGLVRMLPPKIRESFADGAAPPQLAGVLQKSSLPPPFQVRSAARAGVAATAMRKIAVTKTDRIGEVSGRGVRVVFIAKRLVTLNG